MYHGSPCGCIYMYVYSFSSYERINARDEPQAVKWASGKLSLSKKTFLAGNFSLFIKSSLDILAYEASLHRVVTYAIYSETCIIVLGQLLIRLLILIKQSLPKRKHHLFYHWADGINGCSMWTQKKSRIKMLYYFIPSILVKPGKHSFATYLWIKFQIKLSAFS